MDDGTDGDSEEELVPRVPSLEDLVALCRELNARGARYLVVGGFAIRTAGYIRETIDIDYVIDSSLENEAKVYAALETLPDSAVLELDAGDVSRFTVVRVGDEFTVDLMASASGRNYDDLSKDQIIREIDGVPIPFASPRMLWLMKKDTHREKDLADLIFLKQQYPEFTD